MGEALAEGTPNDLLALILDLSSLDYIDSAGIQLIYRLREGLRIRGQDWRIVIAPSSMAHDALRLAGVSGHADIVETLDQAFQGLPAQAADADQSGSERHRLERRPDTFGARTRCSRLRFALIWRGVWEAVVGRGHGLGAC